MNPLKRRRILRLFLLFDLGLLVLLAMFLEARRMPAVRRADIALPGLTAGSAPLRVALVTDTHMTAPDQSPARLARIVRQVNRERPDLVLLGGDYVGGKIYGWGYGLQDAISPFAGFRARYGIVAVLGNHDWEADGAAVAGALRRAGVRLLENEAVTVGPLALAGLGDVYSGHDDVPRVLAAMRGLPGAKVVLTHSPDAMQKLDGAAALVLAGHNHCGQLSVPLIGPLWVPSDQGYVCGQYQVGPSRLIVSAGAGTSLLPIRAFARPDIWIVTLRARP